MLGAPPKQRATNGKQEREMVRSR